MNRTSENYEISITVVNWIAELKSVLPTYSIRELFSVFLLLRWLDVKDEELELIAEFEERDYVPALPSWLQIRRWNYIKNSAEVRELIRELAEYAGSAQDEKKTAPEFEYLRHLIAPLRHIQHMNMSHLLPLIQGIGDIQLNPLNARRILLDIFEIVLNETRNPHDGEYSSSVNLSRLIAELVYPQPGEHIYDPCFGGGNFLISAWNRTKRYQDDDKQSAHLLHITGDEVNSGAFLTGLTRIVLSGISSPHLIHDDGLERSTDSDKSFDIVMAHPPVGVRASSKIKETEQFRFNSSDLTGLFVQQTLSKLKPEGRAVIVVPEGFLFRGGADRDLRQFLLREGIVQSVVGLPAGLLNPNSRLRGYLLILDNAGGFRQVQMVDYSNLQELKASNIATAPLSTDVETLARNILGRNYRGRTDSSLHTLTERTSIQNNELIQGEYNKWLITVDELADFDWDLTPRRRDRNELLSALLPFSKPSEEDSYSVVLLSSISDISAGHQVKSVNLDLTPHTANSPGYIQVRDLVHGKVARVTRWLKPDVLYNPQWTLLPGDVLISRSGTIGKSAIVSQAVAGSIAGHGLYVIRPQRNVLDPDYLLAYINSGASQNWFSAYSRGSQIQSINREAVIRLPIPLFPLLMQQRAAAQFQASGSDIITYISTFTGYRETRQYSNLLSGIENRLPRFVPGTDATPSLDLLVSVVDFVHSAQKQSYISNPDEVSARWLGPLLLAISSLEDVAKIPAGPGLLSILRDTERLLHSLYENTAREEHQVQIIGERLREWLKSAIVDLTTPSDLRILHSPASLPSDSHQSFDVKIENQGVLPLRGIRIHTFPDWGSMRLPYLAEKSSFSLHLQGETPKVEGRFALRLQWETTGLSGQENKGEIELVFAVSESSQVSRLSDQEIGNSPYVTGSPLAPKSGHNVFFGREVLLKRIRRQISTQGNVVLLEGNRRAGKTSILKHLEGKNIIQGWLSVYCSLQGIGGTSTIVGVRTVDVFRGMAHSIASALGKASIDVPLPDGKFILKSEAQIGRARRIDKACREGIREAEPFIDFRAYLEDILEVLAPLKSGLVVMLDEFDKLQEGIDSGVTSPQVPENIRYLIQSYPAFSAILTGSRRLKRLREEYWSALFGLGTNFQVTALDQESARKVVTEPVRDRLIFAPDAVDKVLQLTARHPYLMQCLCNRVFDFAIETRSKNISSSIIEGCAKDLVRDNEHFASLWDYANQGPATGRYRRHLILMFCAQSDKKDECLTFGSLQELLAQNGVDVHGDELDQDLAYLRELELIDFSGQIDGGEYHLTIPLMADWIAQQQDIDVVLSHARTEIEDENV